MSKNHGVCQTRVLNNDLIRYVAGIDSSTKKFAPEKLYLQFDKPYYGIGDTIWIKAYLLNSYLTASDKSGIINIDIANDSNKVVKQYRLPVIAGLSWGNLPLDEKEGFTTGSYTVRAYTNWMRNFGDDYFFYKSIYICGSNENNLLVNTGFNTSAVDGKDMLSAKLLFSDIDKKPFRLTPLQLEVLSGNRHLYKQKLQTGIDGTLNINFNIPQKLSNLVIVAESEQKDKKAVIPIDLNRSKNADIQFLPEGGSLVAGLPAHIGFKAIGEDGKGVDISGIITDHSQREAARFKSLHKGIGSFDLAVQNGESYTAKVTLPGGLIKTYPLPAVKTTGMVLRVKNPMESDSVTVAIAATSDIMQSGNSYFLIGKARGVVCYAAVFNFLENNSIQKKIAKSLFPTGITHFTILTTKFQPLNERLVYIDHHDNLAIKFIPDKLDYHLRDSITLKIKVTDNTGKTVRGHLSLAVTNDAQVKTDSLNSENIITRMLLSSDLKGYIEEPGYYLLSKTTNSWQALDNLLLTQGWIGYEWGQVSNAPVFAFQPERDFVVKGFVTNVFNKPVKGTNVLLFSKSPLILMDTLTDRNGKFYFNRLPRVDTPIFVLKAVNKNGKSFNVRVNIDEIKPPIFIKPVNPSLMPWYVNTDNTLLNYTKNQALLKQQESFQMGGHVLHEVKITANRVIKDSQNLNGPGNADIVIDENELEKSGKKSFLDLFYEKIPGFRVGSLFTKNWFFVKYKWAVFIIDGVELTYINHINDYNELRSYFQSYSAEDIKGIEVNFSGKYNAAYEKRFNLSDDFRKQYVFIEITTRSGYPIIDNTPGLYLYKPLPINIPKDYYKPKYTAKDTTNHLQDFRSTVDWEPNIVTDANGEARLWFYTGDKPSTYTIIAEGTDMNGRLGFKYAKLDIGKSNEKPTK